jgi:hypothetical protein
MKVSPMFVVWQHEKPRVVTDHSGSGINDGIPQAEAKVKYDDMQSLGRCSMTIGKRTLEGASSPSNRMSPPLS